MDIKITEIIAEAHGTAINSGWWDGAEAGPTEVAAKLALIHSEISEALECVRDGMWREVESESGKPEGLPVELADAVIRIADLCGWLSLDLNGAIVRKMNYNRRRSYRHGGKAL